MDLNYTYNEDSDEEITQEQTKDDKLLCDLHLNSALNIDALRYANKEPVCYNMFVNKTLEHRLASAKIAGRRIQKHLYNKDLQINEKIGCVELKAKLTRIGNEVEALTDPVVEELLDNIQHVFESKDMCLRLGEIRSSMINRSISLPAGLMTRFRTVMNLCMAISEKLRGGPKIVMDGESIETESGFFYSIITSSRDEKGFLATDGTILIGGLGDEGWITIWEDLLALLDTLGQRICSFLSHSMASMIHERGWIEPDAHIKVIDQFDISLLKFGNSGYKLIGMFETLCVGVLLEKNPDGINDPLQLSMNMFGEVEEIIKEENLPRDEVIRTFDTLYALLAQMDNNQLSNIFCEYRIWGHPYVDIYKGMKKVQSVGCKRKTISPYYPQYMTRIFKEFVVTGHYRKHKKYPRGLIDGLSDDMSYLENQIKRNRMIERYSPGYSLEDWDRVSLQRIFNIPSTYDITHILNDKAISPKLSEIKNAVRENKQLSSMDGRRGIVAWLMGNTLSCHKLLEDISRNGMSIEDCVIGMYEKEREMKIEARMFALMSEVMRYYFVVTEGLIADNLLHYFPQITMKDSLNKLQKRMWSAGTRGSGRYDVNVNIDFSKWNTNMRAELMTPLFAEMDRTFGLKDVISRTHEIFTSSLIYSCSGKFQPEMRNGEIVTDGPMCYRGHLGGMEGLRQKGWTIGTVCLIEQVSRMVGVKYNLMGQGDNQIIKLKMNDRRWRDYEWSEDEKIRESERITSLFVETLEKVFAEVGLPVKPKECWRSHLLFMYGKSMILENDTLAQWEKKLLRSYALSNEGVLTIGGTIGTIATNCMSSCMTMTKPELGYALYLYLGTWTLRFLTQYHPFSREKMILSSKSEFVLPGYGRRRTSSCSLFEFCVVSLLIPSACGGSINIPFTSYIIRGFPDPASEAYCWVKLLKNSHNREMSNIAANFYSYLQPKQIRLAQLASSPLSINHVKVLSPTLSAKKEATSFLRKNFSMYNNVVAMDEIIQSRYESLPVEDILATDPINPLIFSEIISTFPHKVSEDLIGRVKSTRTIKKLAIQHATAPIITRLQKGEMNFVSYLKWRMRAKGESYSECATQHVRIIRDIGWGRKINGVSTPHPLEMCRIDCVEGSRCELSSDYVYVQISEGGGFSPYLGSSVKNKVASTGDENVRSEPLLQTIMKLASYANWMGLGGNYKKLIKELGEYYGGSEITNIIDRIHSTEGNYAGATEHRFITSMMSDGCFINYAPQVGSRVYMSTDNMKVYGRGQTNYTLHFQALFGFFQYMIQTTHMIHHGHIHICCDTCVIPVVDTVADIPKTSCLLPPDIKNVIHKVLGLEIREEIEYEDVDTSLMDIILNESLSLDMISRKYVRVSLTVYTALKISIDLVGDTLEETEEMTTGLADLQKFPRIYGKKVYQDELLHYVCMYSIILAGIYKQSALDGRSLEKVKRYLIDRISHLSKDKLASLGSMMIGDNLLNPTEHFLVDSIGAMYPTSLDEHVYGSATTLIRKIQAVGTMEYFGHPRILYLPKNDLREVELAVALITHDLLVNRRSDLYNEYLEDQKFSSLIYGKRGTLHRKTLTNIRIIEGSLDRAYKLVEAISTPKFSVIQSPLVFQGEWEDVIKRIRQKTCTIKIDPQIPSETGIKEYQEISLPTSAIYKWRECTQNFPVSKYNIVLGDGTGTTSFVVSGKKESAIIFPMALMERKDIIPQDISSLCPKISRCLKNVCMDAVLSIPDDINHPKFIELLKNFLSSLDKKDITLWSDIEMLGGSIFRSSNISTLITLPVRMIIKAYIHEITDDCCLFKTKFSSMRMMVSTLGNIHYGEIFLWLEPGDGFYYHRKDIINMYNHSIRLYDSHSSIASILQVTEDNIYLCELSFNLCLRHLDNLGITFDRGVFSLSAPHLLTYVVIFINTHYSFKAEPNSGLRERIISPGKRRRIERLLQILLIATSSSISRPVLESIKLIHKIGGHLGKYPYVNGFCVVNGHKTILSRKDLQVARCIRCRRRRAGLAERDVTKYSDTMSENLEDLLGFLTQAPISEMIYRCSGTFESGSTARTDDV